EALYFACMMYDSDPSKIVARLARRDDEVESDFINIRFDSYHDHQTGFEFTVNAAGVKVDILGYNDGDSEDSSWDPVWDVETRITEDGWIAEIKIPFSMLRFSEQTDMEWGIEFYRRISRKQEDDLWVLIRKSDTGLMSRFGHLVGLKDIPAPTNLEMIPYAVNTNRLLPKSNAYPEGHDLGGNAGFDLKFRPASWLTVDATFNPDFGQVEADPAVLNLSTFETFYPEKRPFFIEGVQILKFTTFGDEFGPGLFYSRRIGKSVRAQAPSPGGYFEDEPRFATILGAAKVSGKTSNGLSLGVLEAVTQEERATFVDSAGQRSDRLVEPLVNYSLVRLRQDFWENSNAGMIITSVNREDRIPAMTAGVDWRLRLMENEYQVSGFLAGSRTTLGGPMQEGTAGRLTVDKIGGKHWRGSLSTDFTSKKFNINDMGFFRRPNDYGYTAEVLYRDDVPDEWKRQWNASLFFHDRYTFDDIVLFRQVVAAGYLQLHNFWQLNLRLEHDFSALEDRETRGNGFFRKPTLWRTDISVQSDSRQLVVADFSLGAAQDSRSATWINPELELEFKPASSVTMEVALGYQHYEKVFAWVANVPDPLFSTGMYSVFAERTTTEWDLTSRGTFVFTRDLTLQLYLQLFFAQGKFENYQRRLGEDSYEPLAYSQPDFNDLSFNSNIVLRWEYLPGSTAYFVWSQARKGNYGQYATPFFDNVSNTFSLPMENVLLLKISYWWSV
ncbi:MAG: carbohydrate binding family 9 domain-containing protein, partial [Ignavibacteriae bacterium]|nr:carbohydrate binding family 9 domain-containing protein [Ignavibacteriota bacterium]